MITRHVLAGHHDTVAHAGYGTDGVLDLAQFDPEAAHLHLVIRTSKEFDASVGVPAHEIAGPVHAGLATQEGVGQESLGGQVGSLPVA